MADLTELVRIDDPQFYVNDPYPVFARMRKEAPAFGSQPRVRGE